MACKIPSNSAIAFLLSVRKSHNSWKLIQNPGYDLKNFQEVDSPYLSYSWQSYGLLLLMNLWGATATVAQCGSHIRSIPWF